jgi:hypothetical protein
MDENLDSLQNLRDNLKEYGLKLEELPWVIQYNKRDLPEVYTLEELNQALNPDGVPSFEAVAMTGDGVFETFRGVSKLVLHKLSREVKLGEGRMAQKMSAAPKAEAPAPVVQAPDEAPAESPATIKMEAPAPRRPAAVARPASPPPAPSDTAPVEAAPASAPRPAVEETQVVAAAHATTEPRVETPPARPTWSPPRSSLTQHRWEEDEKPGFWARLFGRGRSTPAPSPAQEPHVSSVSLSPVGGSGATEPVVIEKRVTVPITLGPEEVLRGARLRLVLEVQVDAAAVEKTSRVA